MLTPMLFVLVSLLIFTSLSVCVCAHAAGPGAPAPVVTESLGGNGMILPLLIRISTAPI